MVDRALEYVRQRQEISVEDQDELALGGPEAILERPGLEPRAIHPMDVLDIELRMTELQLRELAPADLAGLVGRVVQHLDLEPVAWVADGSHGVEQPFHHVHLIEEGELHGHGWQIRERARRA